MEPKASNPYVNLAGCYEALNRPDEAKAILEQAIRNGIDTPAPHERLRRNAYGREDLAEAARQEAWLQARSGGTLGPGPEVTFHDLHGRYKKAAELAARAPTPGAPPGTPLGPAHRSALLGDCGPARGAGPSGLAVGQETAARMRAGVTLALCGEPARAEAYAREIREAWPESTLVNSVEAPVIMAAVALAANQPIKAVEALRPAERYERAQFLVVHLRALAYLRAKSAPEAVAEYQKILDRRGAYWGAGSAWAAAYVGLARAQALHNNKPAARKAYEDFFALWKDADPDIPILVQARKEYAALP